MHAWCRLISSPALHLAATSYSRLDMLLYGAVGVVWFLLAGPLVRMSSKSRSHTVVQPGRRTSTLIMIWFQRLIGLAVVVAAILGLIEPDIYAEP